MIKESFSKLMGGGSLSAEDSAVAMAEIMTGGAPPVLVGAYLTALHMKGESVEEIVGAAKIMREYSLKVSLPEGSAVDLCGTGGDGKNTFNISTISSFVLAGSGVTVAKHGNRAASSMCGSADLLEGLGVNIELSPDGVEKCFKEAGIGFMFAPVFHPAMKNVVPIRKELGIRTIFNMLGPLTNPAGVKTQLIGVFDRSLLVSYAEVLRGLGAENAIIVHGEGGYDEATTTGLNFIARLKDGKIFEETLDPQSLGFSKSSPDEIAGGDAEKNMAICNSILKGGRGPEFDTIVINSALALVAVGKAMNYKEGLAIAREAIDNGAAMRALEKMVKVSNEVAG